MNTEDSVGALLRYWRGARRLSQLELALAAEVSSRHLSFIESGRARPSREMVLLLARVLDLPLRERNTLLLTAGFAPVYQETTLEAPELEAIRGALDAILRQQEPFPAIVMNRYWDVLRTNDAANRFMAFLLGDRVSTAPSNILRMFFDVEWVRPYIANWEAVAEALVQRVRRESVGGVPDERTRALLAELLTYPGVPKTSQSPSHDTPMIPVLPVSFVKGDKHFDFFSAVTTLGTPQDITVQEIRIETFFPADAATETVARSLLS